LPHVPVVIGIVVNTAVLFSYKKAAAVVIKNLYYFNIMLGIFVYLMAYVVA